MGLVRATNVEEVLIAANKDMLKSFVGHGQKLECFAI